METQIRIEKAEPVPEVLEQLIAMSQDWEAEQSCFGYRRNTEEDILGNEILLAYDGEETVGYLFGHPEASKNAHSIMPEGTPVFEIMELYVRPAYRSRGVGRQLMEACEAEAGETAEYLMLSTATKNWKAILHFYVEEAGMEFWSARLFKKINAK